MNFQYGEDKIWLENEEGKQIALIEFPKVKEGLVNITHTEVDQSLQGQGIAGKLTQALAIYLREKGLKTNISCSYALKWFLTHEEYQDVLNDLESIKKQAERIQGPACGIRTH